ncbi:MAG: hypothetical protein ACXVFT_02070 [Solirubrobacteraceae bacterium]
MNLVRNIARDLVEKRLWPVAVALVAALVALPILLGGGSTAAVPAPGATAAAPAGAAPAGGQAAVSLDTTLPAGEHDRGGKVRNPFKQPKVAAAKTATPSGTSTTSTSSAGGGGAGTPASTGGTPTTTGTSPSGTTTPGTTATKPDSLDTYRLTLRFGQAGSLRTMRDLARLSPLPSDSNPFFVYLGVLKDGKTAVFLISSDVVATGDGKCRPSANNCETVEVQEGDTEFFDMEKGGQPVQYEMDVLHLDKTSSAQRQVTAAAARAAATRHSKAGAATLRAAHADAKQAFDGMNGYRWLPNRGVLTRVPAAATTSSTHGAGATAHSALPGLPVWHAELTV